MSLPSSLADVDCWAINLDRRADRWAWVTGHLRNRGLQQPQRFAAIDGRLTTSPDEIARYRRELPSGIGPIAADIGCTKSHLGLLRCLAEAPKPWTLIVEDDVALHRDIHPRWSILAPKAPKDALMILLGCKHEQPPVSLGEGEPSWCRITHATCAHAYLVSDESLPLLIEATADVARSFDVAWNQVHQLGRTYAPLPHLAIQREDYSDISGRRRPIRSRHLGIGVQ